MAAIVWTEEASVSLQRIFAYLHERNPEAAIATVEGIYDRVALLATFPRVGHAYRSRASEGVRLLVQGPYVVPYALREEERVVVVLGVFHGAMDVERYLPKLGGTG